MSRTIIAVVLVIAAAGCTRRSDSGFTFTELTYPDAHATVAAGINDAGHVVGWYDMEGRTYGFLHKDGAYSSIQYPGAALTQVYGIAPDGTVSGSYRMPDETDPMAFHGFVMTGSGEFQDVHHPDYKYSMAMGVLADGGIVGCYHNEDGIPGMRGMMVSPAAFTGTGITPSGVTILDTPASMNNGVTPDGTKIVGMISDSGRGYVIDRGVMTPIEAPDARRTEAWGISQSGVIVGVFVDPASVTHGFVLENGRFRGIDYPGAISTVAYGINDRGDIVGAFESAGGQRRGFIAAGR
jgi:probable HAF family extracellular repeat protein